MWLKAAQSPSYKPVDALLKEHGRFQEVKCYDYFSPCQLSKNGDELGRLGFINSRVCRWFLSQIFSPDNDDLFGTIRN